MILKWLVFILFGLVLKVDFVIGSSHDWIILRSLNMISLKEQLQGEHSNDQTYREWSCSWIVPLKVDFSFRNFTSFARQLSSKNVVEPFSAIRAKAMIGTFEGNLVLESWELAAQFVGSCGHALSVFRTNHEGDGHGDTRVVIKSRLHVIWVWPISHVWLETLSQGILGPVVVVLSCYCCLSAVKVFVPVICFSIILFIKN